MFSMPLISAEKANALYGEPDVKFVDATWYLPNVPTNAHDAFLLEHIPGAVYFDIDAVAEKPSELPHVFPTVQTFEKSVGALGISDADRVIIYDRGNFVASARAWWIFRNFGHEMVTVLDGGLPSWKRIQGDLAEDEPEIETQVYRAAAQLDTVVLREQVVDSLSNPSVAIVDARSPGRFHGEEPEPRPGLRGGNIPGSMNMYYGDLLNQDGTLKGSSEISAILDSLSITADQQIVSTCGSGVTAAIVLLAIYQVRQNDMQLYDGSWTEWALHPDSPISC